MPNENKLSKSKQGYSINLNSSNLQTKKTTNYFPGGEGLLIPGNAVVGIIVLEDNRYLCQLRSQRSGIFYPDHWGLFGGAVEDGESPEIGLKRELMEELALEIEKTTFFTEFTFDFNFGGHGKVWRKYYSISLKSSNLKLLKLGEGRAFKAFTSTELLTKYRVVPYDAFAIWMHATQRTETLNIVNSFK